MPKQKEKKRTVASSQSKTGLKTAVILIAAITVLGGFEFLNPFRTDAVSTAGGTVNRLVRFAGTGSVEVFGEGTPGRLARWTGTFTPAATPTFVLVPATASIAVGSTQQFDGKYDPDGPSGSQAEVTVTRTSITWSSSAPSKATVNTSGLATGVVAGSATISGVYSGITATAAVSVYEGFDYSISVSGNVSIGQSGVWGGNTATLSWISGIAEPVTLSLEGVPATVTAKINNGNSSSCTPATARGCDLGLAFQANMGTPTGDYIITVRGVPLGRTATFTLTVMAAGEPQLNASVTCSGVNVGGIALSLQNVAGANRYKIFRNDALIATITGFEYTDPVTEGTFSYYYLAHNDAANTDLRSSTATITDLGPRFCVPPVKAAKFIRYGNIADGMTLTAGEEREVTVVMKNCRPSGDCTKVVAGQDFLFPWYDDNWSGFFGESVALYNLPPPYHSSDLKGITHVARDEFYAVFSGVGNGPYFGVLRWDGTGWRILNDDPLGPNESVDEDWRGPAAVSFLGPSSVYVAIKTTADSGREHYSRIVRFAPNERGRWRKSYATPRFRVNPGINSDSHISKMQVNAEDDIYVQIDNVWRHWDGTRWNSVFPFFGGGDSFVASPNTLYGIQCEQPSPQESCRTVIGKWVDGAWQRITDFSLPHVVGFQLNAENDIYAHVWGASPLSGGFATDGFAHWDGSRWEWMSDNFPAQTLTSTVQFRVFSPFDMIADLGRFAPDRLGSINPVGNDTWGVSRARWIYRDPPRVTTAGDYRDAGDEAHFRFTITAPSTPGIYDFQWQMVSGVSAFFNEPAPNLRITVVPAVTGTIVLNAVKDGEPWTGPEFLTAEVTESPYGPTPCADLNSGDPVNHLPVTLSDVFTGSYKYAYCAGGPPGTVFAGITEDPPGNLNGGTKTFTFNFTTPNDPPVVNAGSEQSITLPVSSISLDGTATDDGVPAPPTLTVAWSKESGPGSVTFENTTSIDTTASFPADRAGVYVLKLTAFDRALSSSDTLTITVLPVVSTALTATPSSGSAPLDTVLRAGVSGGNPNSAINYSFWWDCDSAANTVVSASLAAACGLLPSDPAGGDGQCAVNARGAKCDGERSDVFDVAHTYGSVGSPRAKVIVERDTASDEERATVTVTAPVAVSGVCQNAVVNACDAGTLRDDPDSETQNLWTCRGQNGGSDSPQCAKNKSSTPRFKEIPPQ